ncbi:lipase 3-like [Neodiprion lecontei]|uniref:Lipase n=1 Tax=Neodiprion lecontei TaxID=441921 RepID=A0A6J0C298_NEOLC|nr:lipase 3-like [Neodiprion lecontei]
MIFLLLLVKVLIGSAVAEIHATVWTQEMVQNLFTAAGEVGATVPAMIARHGYMVETHHVTTYDGYILQMHRIPATPTSPAATNKSAVFLMHGLLSSSADWVVMGPGKGLAYILADAGYDVWMGNARGNTYSKNHTTITDFAGKEFWDFEWHQIGYYDLPAMIDYTLTNTGQRKLIYVGHSQGTTSFYVMASAKPEYNDKINVMFSLAPVAYMGNLKSPLLRLTSTLVNTLEAIFDLFGEYEFLPKSDLIALVGSKFCHDDALTQFLCSNVLFLMCGFNKAQLNTTMLPVIFKHTPAGASTRQLVHYGQEIMFRKFRQYDYGPVLNLHHYHKITPPNYNLGRISAPVHLLYSDNDWMAAVSDVEKLYSELGNPVEKYRILDGKWNHLDFLWGINAKELVYNHILTTLENQYSD